MIAKRMARSPIFYMFRRHRHHRRNHRAQRADPVRKHGFRDDAHAFRRHADKARKPRTHPRAARLPGSARSSSIPWSIPISRAVLADSGALMLDVFAPFIAPLEPSWAPSASPRSARRTAWWISPSTSAHQCHQLRADPRRRHRLNYDEADVILVGVSRSGKTPTCLYLALHFGVKAANYPLTDEDLEDRSCRSDCAAHRRKLFGLTIDPLRLQQVRQARRPAVAYATLEQCRREVAAAEALFRRERLPVAQHHAYLDRGNRQQGAVALGIERHLF
jgi:hypothetical protein